MPPKKVKAEPAVIVPEGDASAGRNIFDQHCSACHALEGDNKSASAPTLGYILINIYIYTVVSLEEQLEQQHSPTRSP